MGTLIKQYLSYNNLTNNQSKSRQGYYTVKLTTLLTEITIVLSLCRNFASFRR